MAESFKVSLEVNKRSIELNPFVEEFLARITVGAASSLKGVEKIKNLEVHQERGNVTVKVDGKEVPLAAFPNDIISSTLTGLVTPLKGVDKVESLDIKVEVEG
ncbi:MAG: hypothetical protein JSU92_05960 [Deltaproteobacteria bacterium]|nr:MAG: hypothetical protein JSU92_05960 [Deltaproteobacteria bacterium]